MTIRIDPEFQSLIPPLSGDELEGLTISLIQEGNREPIVVWKEQGIIVDGHTRFDICSQFDIPLLSPLELSFLSREDAKEWAIRNQFNRRNINAYQRSVLALKLENLYRERAKANERAGGGSGSSGRQKSDNPTDTKKELGLLAGVSHDTIMKVKKIVEKASPAQKRKLESGDESINSVFHHIKRHEVMDRLETPSLVKQYPVDIRHGDFRDVLSDIEDGSVRMILTDPPYGRRYLDLWRDLGVFASRVLRPDDGVLVSYAGQMSLPDTINCLSENLDWWWLMTVAHAGSGSLITLGNPVRKIVVQFKPILVFVPKGGAVACVLTDLLNGTGAEKGNHNWAQPVAEAVELFKRFEVEAGDLVIDPFAGSGSIGQAAKELGLQFIGADILLPKEAGNG